MTTNEPQGDGLEALRSLIELATRYGPITDYSCGPESGCDVSCMEAASFASRVKEAHIALAHAEAALSAIGPGPCGVEGHTMAMAGVRCKDCGTKQDSHQQEYDQDCRCGGSFATSCRICTLEADRDKLREAMQGVCKLYMLPRGGGETVQESWQYYLAALAALDATKG